MKEISKAQAALLGLLSECPMHPYQIEREVEFRDMRSWTELSMSSIYKLLVKLEERGLVTRKDEISDENRLRKLYYISPEGKSELEKKLLLILNEPEHPKWSIDVATYNLDVLDRREALDALGRYRKELENRIRYWQDVEKCLEELECPDHRFAVARRPVYLLRGEIEWVDSYMESIGRE